MSSSRTLSCPAMMMFSTRSSSTSGWSRPSRNSESKTARASASCCGSDHARVAGVHAVGHRRLDEVEHDRPAELLLRRLVEPSAVRGDGLAELLGGLRAQRGDERPVDGRPAAPSARRDSVRHGRRVAGVPAAAASVGSGWANSGSDARSPWTSTSSALARHERAFRSSPLRAMTRLDRGDRGRGRLRTSGPVSNRLAVARLHGEKTAAASGSSASVATTGRLEDLGHLACAVRLALADQEDARLRASRRAAARPRRPTSARPRARAGSCG